METDFHRMFLSGLAGTQWLPSWIFSPRPHLFSPRSKYKLSKFGNVRKPHVTLLQMKSKETKKLRISTSAGLGYYVEIFQERTQDTGGNIVMTSVADSKRI